MYIIDYAKSLYKTYEVNGELAFRDEFEKLVNTLVYSGGNQKGQHVDNSYFKKILDEVKKLENSKYLENRKALSQLAMLIQALNEELDTNNFKNSK